MTPLRGSRSALRALGIATLLLLGGCAASGPMFRPAPEPPPGHALVYVYRAPALAIGGSLAHFYVDGKSVFNLSTEGYSYVHLPAGKHEIAEVWTNNTPIGPLRFDVTVVAGETRYFKLTAKGAPGLITTASASIHFGWSVVEVDPAVARDEIRSYRFQDRKDKPNNREIEALRR